MAEQTTTLHNSRHHRCTAVTQDVAVMDHLSRIASIKATGQTTALSVAVIKW